MYLVSLSGQFTRQGDPVAMGAAGCGRHRGGWDCGGGIRCQAAFSAARCLNCGVRVPFEKELMLDLLDPADIMM